MIRKFNGAYLLKNLIDICKDSTVEMSVLAHAEKIFEATLAHLEDCILDSLELALNIRIIARDVAESAKNFQRFILFSLEDQPSRRFW